MASAEIFTQHAMSVPTSFDVWDQFRPSSACVDQDLRWSLIAVSNSIIYVTNQSRRWWDSAQMQADLWPESSLVAYNIRL